ncbi:MAG: RNA methyltransferase [Pseudomonadales bacterium]|nr:RNA methyltransferase [Pseudomonadales bacterium]
MLDNIKIVLIQTFHPGNIGATARAMKNMGLSNLVLVNPVDFPSDEATSRASKAIDVLENATIVSSLEEAIADCSLVVATSARDRTIGLPHLTAREAGLKLTEESQKAKVAVVFGRERMGLHNDDIQQCHMQVNIDSHPDYPVLNISQALQIICYEIYQADLADKGKNYADEEEEFPLQKELEGFYGHLESILTSVNFLDPKRPGQAMQNFRALFRRARPTKKEMNLLRGALKAIESDKNKR